jgi:hypothetical protein
MAGFFCERVLRLAEARAKNAGSAPLCADYDNRQPNHMAVHVIIIFVAPQTGGANVLRATARGALAMALTAGIGKLFGTGVGALGCVRTHFVSRSRINRNSFRRFASALG